LFFRRVDHLPEIGRIVSMPVFPSSSFECGPSLRYCQESAYRTRLAIDASACDFIPGKMVLIPIGSSYALKPEEEA
jgi:hypothetical protein